MVHISCMGSIRIQQKSLNKNIKSGTSYNSLMSYDIFLRRHYYFDGGNGKIPKLQNQSYQMFFEMRFQ